MTVGSAEQNNDLIRVYQNLADTNKKMAQRIDKMKAFHAKTLKKHKDELETQRFVLEAGKEAAIEMFQEKSAECEELKAEIETLKLKIAEQEDEISKLRQEILATRPAPCIGIDLGNTTCSIAYFEDGTLKHVPNENGETTFNSSLRCTPQESEDVNDPFILGAEPTTNDDIVSLMNCLGLSHDELQQLLKVGDLLQPCKDLQSQNGSVMFEFASRPGYPFSTSSLMTILLSKLQCLAVEHFNPRPVSDTYLVIPALYGDRQRRNLVKTATLAQFNKIRLICESAAAFKAYQQLSGDPKPKVLVVSMGSRHTEVSLFENGTLIASAMSNKGGHSVDVGIMKRCLEAWNTRWRFVESIRSKLSEECRLLKESLSKGADEASFEIEFNNKTHYFKLTQEDLVVKILPKIFARLELLTKEVIEGKGKIDEIVICGQAMLFPQFAEELRQSVPSEPPIFEGLAYPEAVADGAAIVASGADEMACLPVKLDFELIAERYAEQVVLQKASAVFCKQNDVLTLTIARENCGTTAAFLLVKQNDSVLGVVNLSNLVLPQVLTVDIRFDIYGIIDELKVLEVPSDDENQQAKMVLVGHVSYAQEDETVAEDLKTYWAEAEERRLRNWTV